MNEDYDQKAAEHEAKHKDIHENAHAQAVKEAQELAAQQAKELADQLGVEVKTVNLEIDLNELGLAEGDAAELVQQAINNAISEQAQELANDPKIQIEPSMIQNAINFNTKTKEKVTAKRVNSNTFTVRSAEPIEEPPLDDGLSDEERSLIKEYRTKFGGVTKTEFAKGIDHLTETGAEVDEVCRDMWIMNGVVMKDKCRVSTRITFPQK